MRISLQVDLDMAQLRGGVIIPEISLYCVLQYLAGGSYTDIFLLVYPKHCSTMLMEDDVCHCPMQKPTNYVAGYERIGCAECGRFLLH